jgi:hypothetical protein
VPDDYFRALKLKKEAEENEVREQANIARP